MENEAKTKTGMIHDDQTFNEHLIEMIESGVRPSKAISLYCARHGMNGFGFSDMRFSDPTPRLRNLKATLLDNLQDDLAFDAYLIDSVVSGEMLATYGLYFYCGRHGITQFTICDLQQTDDSPRSPVVEFFDRIIGADDFAGFLNVVEKERIGGGP